MAVLRLIELYVYSFAIGNTDLHAKNISVWRNPKTGLVEMTPCYDLVSTLAYPKLDSRMALKLDGKDDNFRPADFVRFAERCGVAEKAILDAIARITSGVRSALPETVNFGFDDRAATRFQQKIEERLSRLAQ